MKKNSIKRWIILSFTAILLLSVAASAVANYSEAYRGAMRESEEMAEVFADLVSRLMSHPWQTNPLDEPTEGIAYENSRTTLRSLCQCFRMDQVSIYRIDPETGTRYYYFSVSSDSEQNNRLQEELALRTVPADGLLPGEQTLLAGSREMQRSLQHDRLSEGITWLAPYVDQNGELRAMIAMDDDFNMIRRTILRNFIVDIIPFALSLLIGLLVLLLLVQRRIASPIGEISDNMRLFAQNSRKKPEPLNIHSRDEIGEIAESFEKMTEDISEYINNIEKLTLERTETNTQLEMARRIQYGLVPEKTDLTGDGFRISAMTRPAKAVGGDFYDCFPRDENSVCIVMGDVSGKGMSAAICMAMVKTEIREKLSVGLSPAETLNRTNYQLFAQNPENLFVTIFVAVLNTKTGELCYANAGHTWPVLLKKEPAFLIPESGIALGIFEDVNLKDYTLLLTPAQGILLYTDGVTEAVDPQRTFFGEERLLAAVKGASSDADPAREAVLRVSRSVSAFCDGSEPFDDMAVLALVYGGKSGWKTLPVALSSFDEVRKSVFAAAGDTPETRLALLACDEALTNIVNYSGAANLLFSCEKRDGQLCVSFSDDGIPFDPTAAAMKEKEFEMLDSGGMGLNLIAQVVSSMNYERKNDRNVFTLFISL